MNISAAIKNLFAAKLRSLLAILGILIGTASVVALVSSGELATQAALAEFKSLGTNLLAISIYADPSIKSDSAHKFTLQDAISLQQASADILFAAPYTTNYSNLNYAGQNLQGGIIGADQNLARIIKIQMQSGRFVSSLDKNQAFCIIGQGLYQQIKQQGIANPLNTQLRVGNNIYTIIGVAAQWPENGFFYQDVNQSIIIPLENSLYLNQYAEINNIVFSLRDDSNIDAVKTALTSAINKIAPGKNIYIRSAKEIIDKMQAQQRTFTILLGVIGGISLLVGGIGVMNIMLVSVIERRREIGIRRAVGARKHDIQILFLVESVILSLFGGMCGVILGILASYIIAHFSHWQFMLFVNPPLIGFGVSVAIGIFFGFYPAYRAAQLNPITALRTE